MRSWRADDNRAFFAGRFPAGGARPAPSKKSVNLHPVFIQLSGAPVNIVNRSGSGAVFDPFQTGNVAQKGRLANRTGGRGVDGDGGYGEQVFGMSVDAGLQRYIREIRKAPVLEPGEEQALARRLRDHGDGEAMRRLVGSHMRLVVKVAMRYRRYSVPIEDLISEGAIGLMKAVERFDPDRGFRLSTYALWWIRAAMTDFVIRSWSLVRMGQTTEQRKLFFNLRKMKANLRAYDEGDLRDDDVRRIASELNVPEKDVVEMNGRLAGQDASLNAPVAGTGEGEWQDWLADDGEIHGERLEQREEFAHRRLRLEDVMRGLKDREREIVTERHLVETPKTLEALSRRHQISRERVRQIEHEAVAKIKRWMEQGDAVARP